MRMVTSSRCASTALMEQLLITSYSRKEPACEPVLSAAQHITVPRPPGLSAGWKTLGVIQLLVNPLNISVPRSSQLLTPGKSFKRIPVDLNTKGWLQDSLHHSIAPTMAAHSFHRFAQGLSPGFIFVCFPYFPFKNIEEEQGQLTGKLAFAKHIVSDGNV